MKRPSPKQTVAALAAATIAVLGTGTAYAVWSAASSGDAFTSTDTLAAPVQGAPTNITATGAQINWTAVTSGWQKDATYTASVSGGSQTCSNAASVGNCTLGGLESGVTYTVTVTASFSSWTSAASSIQSVTTTATVAAPSTPDLATASDSGSSSTDNVTKITTPTFTGTAPANATVKLFAGSTQIGAQTLTGGATAWSITSSGLTDNTYAMTATATVGSSTSAPSGALSVTIDTASPTASSVALAGSTPTNAGPLTWTVTFSEPVTGTTASNFSAVKGSGITGTLGTPSVSGSGSTWTVSVATTGVTGGNANNTVGLNLVNSTGIKDIAGNALSTASLTGATYAYDTTAPSASSIALAGTTPTNTGPLTWTVTFNEAVTGVTASNFATVNGSGITGTLGTPSLSGSGTTWTVSVSTTGVTGGNANNSVGLNLANNTGIKDLAGNALSTTSLTGSTYTYDTTAPVISNVTDAHNSANKDDISGNTTENNGTITVAIYAGSTVTGNPVKTYSPTSITGSASPFSWSLRTGGNDLTGGSQYTASVTQTDSAGNTSAAVTKTFTAN